MMHLAAPLALGGDNELEMASFELPMLILKMDEDKE